MKNELIKHTPEPWIICNGTDLFTELGETNASGQTADSNDGWQIADCSVGLTRIDGILATMDYKEQLANARRIVAAVNACAGLTTESLEFAAAENMKLDFQNRVSNLKSEAERLRMENERLRDALGKIAKHRHRDKSCSLEAQGYSQVECAEIGAKDWLAGIAFGALSETTLSTPTPVKPELINAQLLEVLKEADEYLSENNLNQIGHQSILHSKMISAIAAAEGDKPVAIILPGWEDMRLKTSARRIVAAVNATQAMPLSILEKIGGIFYVEETLQENFKKLEWRLREIENFLECENLMDKFEDWYLDKQYELASKHDQTL